MEKIDIRKTLEKHLKWIHGEHDGERANLRGANLCGFNLYEAFLYKADLYGANLCGANLQRANLYGANLCGANLYMADLRDANLCRANLHGANLCEAYLKGANLPIESITKIFPLACPESGAFIGWKKAIVIIDNSFEEEKEVVIKLQIPEDACRSSALGRKCRCDKAIVLSIESFDGNTSFDQAVSLHDDNFYYNVGSTVSVDNFDVDRMHECAAGIHFFITRQEAIEY